MSARIEAGVDTPVQLGAEHARVGMSLAPAVREGSANLAETLDTANQRLCAVKRARRTERAASNRIETRPADV